MGLAKNFISPIPCIQKNFYIDGRVDYSILTTPHTNYEWGYPPASIIFHFLTKNFKTMNNYIITSGDFTNAGNFSGYNAKSVRIHFHKRQMDSLGFSKENPPTYPFYCIAETKTFDARKDDKGNPIPYSDGKFTMTRLSALSAFKDKSLLISAHAEESLLDKEIEHEINKIATTRGLTSDSVAQLANASI